MTEMSKKEIIGFLMQNTFTGNCYLRKEGGSHVVPIWFVLDNKPGKYLNHRKLRRTIS